MTQRPPLTHCGCDVALLAALPCGRVRIAYVDRHGIRNGQAARVWPHELRGVGWHLADIKRAIADLSAPAAPPPRPMLFAHHVAAASERED